MRFDPITPDEYERIRGAIPGLVASLSFPPEERDDRIRVYSLILDTLYQTGIHPGALARRDGELERHGPIVKITSDGPILQWRRPKTLNWCLMPITKDLAEPLAGYLALPFASRYGRGTIWRIVKDASKLAGVEGVTPLTLRHTKALSVFKKHGPSVAKESLSVGDRALQHYTALSADTRLRLLRGDMDQG